MIHSSFTGVMHISLSVSKITFLSVSISSAATFVPSGRKTPLSYSSENENTASVLAAVACMGVSVIPRSFRNFSRFFSVTRSRR